MQADFGLNEQQCQLIQNYLNLLQQWNQTYNLTAIHDLKAMELYHIADSLSILPYLNGSRIIDVGTGAGLPGIPLAIASPDREFFLLDSVGKKIKFLNQVIWKLKLNNVQIVHSRVEKYQSAKCFDSIVTRAFSSMGDMLLATQHLCCKEGLFLAMKGKIPEEELKELGEKPFRETFVVDKIIPLRISEEENLQRQVICIRFRGAQPRNA